MVELDLAARRAHPWRPTSRPLRAMDDVLYAICSSELAGAQPPLVRPAPLAVPPLIGRQAELDRVIAEYASDAIAELAAPPSSFTISDHAWVREHAAASLVEIEKATLRLVANRTSRNVTGAAARLGMAPVSLFRWVGRRKLLRMILAN